MDSTQVVDGILKHQYRSDIILMFVYCEIVPGFAYATGNNWGIGYRKSMSRSHWLWSRYVNIVSLDLSRELWISGKWCLNWPFHIGRNGKQATTTSVLIWMRTTLRKCWKSNTDLTLCHPSWMVPLVDASRACGYSHIDV